MSLTVYGAKRFFFFCFGSFFWRRVGAVSVGCSCVQGMDGVRVVRSVGAWIYFFRKGKEGWAHVGALEEVRVCSTPKTSNRSKKLAFGTFFLFCSPPPPLRTPGLYPDLWC